MENFSKKLLNSETHHYVKAFLQLSIRNRSVYSQRVMKENSNYRITSIPTMIYDAIIQFEPFMKQVNFLQVVNIQFYLVGAVNKTFKNVTEKEIDDQGRSFLKNASGRLKTEQKNYEEKNDLLDEVDEEVESDI